MFSVDWYGVQEEDQVESKVQKKCETVEVERVRSERTVLLKEFTTIVMVMKIGVV